MSSYTGHGKVILIGEHSVVYGYDALALPIKSLQIKVEAEYAESENWMDTKYYHGPFFAAPNEYDGLKYVLGSMLDRSGKDPAIKITYTGEIPMARGLGSSATVALATSHVLNDLLELKLDHRQIMQTTNHAEMINHGKASGLDAATVSSDSLVFFNKLVGTKKIASKLGTTLLIMDTGDLGSTKEAVDHVRQQYETSEQKRQDMDDLGSLADEVKAAWQKQDVQAVAAAFNQAQKLLASFGVSTPKIDHIVQIALADGAFAAKLSGGGLGGIVIALVDSEKKANQIAADCRALIENFWIEEI